MNVWLARNVLLPPTPAWVHSIVSYGAVCACVSNAVVIGCSLAGLRYWQAAALSVVVVTPISYVLQSRFTFGIGRSVQCFIRFAAGIVAGALLFLVIIELFRSLLGMPIWVASPLATLIIVCWNYVASCWAITHAVTNG